MPDYDGEDIDLIADEVLDEIDEESDWLPLEFVTESQAEVASNKSLSAIGACEHGGRLPR